MNVSPNSLPSPPLVPAGVPAAYATAGAAPTARHPGSDCHAARSRRKINACVDRNDSRRHAMAEGRLVGKVAIVTGSGRGIGRSEAMTLAREGASVIASDFGKDEDGTLRAERTAREIREAGGKAVAATEDLATPEGARRTVEVAVEAFGGLDIV